MRGESSRVLLPIELRHVGPEPMAFPRSRSTPKAIEFRCIILMNEISVHSHASQKGKAIDSKQWRLQNGHFSLPVRLEHLTPHPILRFFLLYGGWDPIVRNPFAAPPNRPSIVPRPSPVHRFLLSLFLTWISLLVTQNKIDVEDGTNFMERS